MLKQSGDVFIYSSDAALNQALDNSGGALCKALGAYAKST